MSKFSIEEFLYPKLPYRSVKKRPWNIFKYRKPKICAECEGECCKRCGCHFSPDDFKEITFEVLKKEIDKGYISIDYVDGEYLLQNFGVYILRVRNRNRPIVDIFDGGNPCILLTDKGCKLKYHLRPSGGRLLIPSKNYTGFLSKHRVCSSDYSIEKCCYEWKPHQKILVRLTEYYKDKDISCSL